MEGTLPSLSGDQVLPDSGSPEGTSLQIAGRLPRHTSEKYTPHGIPFAVPAPIVPLQVRPGGRRRAS